jgi:hypothetical protein
MGGFRSIGFAGMIGTTVMCMILGWDRTFPRWDGLILFGTFGGLFFMVD